MIPAARLQKIAVNAIAVSGGEVANKASTFLVYAAVSRLAGLEAFGQLALGLTLLYTCHVFGVAGLPTTLTRLVAKRPASARHLLHLGYYAGGATSLVATLLMVLVAILLQYQTATTTVIAVLSLAVPFYTMSMVTEAVIRGREKMHLIPLGNLPGNALLVGASWLVLWQGAGVLAVAWVVVVSRAVTALGLYGLLVWTLRRERCARGWPPGLAWRLLVRSRIFLWSDSVAAVGASLFAVMLSKFASEAEVGILNAAFQLLQPVQILYRSVGHSAFPALVAAAKQRREAVAELANSVLSLVIRLAFPAALVMFVMASEFLDWVYGGRGFKEGAYVLQILSVGLIFEPLNPVLGHSLWAVGSDRVVFRIVVANVTLTLVLGLVLIGGAGLLGAAICSVVCGLGNTALHYWAYGRRVGPGTLGQDLLRLIPAIAVAMAIIVWLPGPSPLKIVIAVIGYGVVAGLIGLSARPGDFSGRRLKAETSRGS